MTASPEFDPPEKQAERRDQLPSQLSSDDLLSGHEISQVPICKEYLLAADIERLSDLLERALSDNDLLNQFIDQLSPLCADSTEDMHVFHNRLCQTVAESFRRHEEDRAGEQYKSLLKLASVVEFFFDALQDNSVGRMPSSLDQLLYACVGVARKLALDRDLFCSSQTPDVVSSQEFVWTSIAWGHVYAEVLDHISRGLQTAEVRGKSELVEEVKQLVEAQLKWRDDGLGPLQCSHEGFIKIWQHTFLLADALADSRFFEVICGIAEEFVDRRLSEGPDIVVSEFDSDEDIDFKNMIAEALDLCECSALYALASCQYDLRPVALWQRILEEGSLMSAPWSLALVSLAKLDSSETTPHLAKLLNRMGRKPRAQSEEMGLGKRMRHELMAYLDIPGTELVLQQVLKGDGEVFVKPERQERLFRLFEKMLEKPRADWSDRALSRLRWAYEQR